MKAEFTEIRLNGPRKSVSSETKESPQGDDDYDPHLHREVTSPTTNMETFVHLLKGNLGTGILALPQAFKYAGVWAAIISTIFIYIICTHCVLILVDAQYVMCKRLKVPMLTYHETMRAALLSGPKCLRRFASCSSTLLNVMWIVMQIGSCCIYILFVAVNTKAIIDQYASTNISIVLCVVMFLIPFAAITCVRTLKVLAPFSTLANILIFISFGVVCYYIFIGLPSLKDLPSSGSPLTYPLFLGTVLFALVPAAVAIPIENHMKNPKSFGGLFGIFNICMALTTLVYVAMGFFGFWKYGLDAKDSVTLNLPSGDVLVTVVIVLYSIAIYASFGLHFFVLFQLLWNSQLLNPLQNKKHALAWEYVLKMATVLITFTLAASIPLLGLVISLFGAVGLGSLGIIFPVIIDMCVKWPNNYGRCKIHLIKDILLLIFGLVGLAAGLFSATSEIIKQLS